MRHGLESRPRWRSAAAIAVVAGAMSAWSCNRSPKADGATSEPIIGVRGLEGPSAFAGITDDRARAQALFSELAKVLTHPRCVNCHPQDERPLQGDDGRLHEPYVIRGQGGLGAPGLFCTTCHGQENFLHVPGNAKWLLAPEEMAWVGRSAAEICAQLKDKGRNGDRDLEAVHQHLAEDALVAYGWAPPPHPEAAPGNQATTAALFRAWIDAGAACPDDS